MAGNGTVAEPPVEPALRIRALRAGDAELLRTATLTNITWAGPPRFSYADLDAAPDLRHYVDLRSGRGDFGFVAELDGRVVGVVWLMFLGSDDPGYGFVADGVPELSLCVWSGYRGRGVGRALLVRALAEAHTRDVPRVSLSVEEGNPAVRLYEAVGFRPVPDATADGTMVVTTGP